MLYFAYGSNLPIEKIQHKAPSATLLYKGILTHHQLRFHRLGRDNSAKCDAFCTNDAKHYILGVIYQIAPHEKASLDELEGVGRCCKDNMVIIHTDLGEVKAFTYQAGPYSIQPNIVPYTWYKKLVLLGVHQHRFPLNYEHMIECVDAIEDPDEARAKENQAIIDSIKTE